MKKIVSISLGSSLRNHVVELELFNEKFHIERIGTDGDIQKMISLIKDLDGKVDAFGLGGIGLYFHAGPKRFTLSSAKMIVETAKITPIVDGSGLKDLLEARVIKY